MRAFCLILSAPRASALDRMFIPCQNEALPLMGLLLKSLLLLGRVVASRPESVMRVSGPEWE
ncbi:hypothetical protein GQ55_2G137800 [Panicum hallii var. hallii]|uniref:Uncharacterized protein n=1 Tax=Panicum hallii var. hallii TaxID=1504633 RepID=A0A2T7EPK6_9POAL|nr:hypothetical protein GQ55_2G137800 [Panicum hallii var. hallii]